MHEMKSKAFSIYFLLKAKNGLVICENLKKIKQNKKQTTKKWFWLGNSSNFKYYHFLMKLVLLKQISFKIII